MTYKFSQDHLELFFGEVRASGGSNNNPTAQQFTVIYKRLLMRSSVQGGNGNYQKDATILLDCFDDSIKTENDQILTISEVGLIRK